MKRSKRLYRFERLFTKDAAEKIGASAFLESIVLGRVFIILVEDGKPETVLEGILWWSSCPEHI